MSGLLLDTCAVLWIGQGQGLSDAGKKRFAAALQQGEPILVSTMSALEVGLLVSKGHFSDKRRLELAQSLHGDDQR